MISITQKEAREYLLKYQNLYNPRQLNSDEDIVSFIQKIGCIQYDPLNKIARNADLVLQSRCKNYSEQMLYRLLYDKRKLLDGWDKNMSIWSVTDWPYFNRKRLSYINRYQKRFIEFKKIETEIIKKIKENECINSKDVNCDYKVNWSWAPTDIGRAILESMYHCGELVIHHKEGSRKFYGFTKNLLPNYIINATDPNTTLADYQEWYVKRKIGSIGLLWNKSGDAWIGSNLRKEERTKSFKNLLEKKEIVVVKIESLEEIFYLPTKEVKLLEDKKHSNEASIIAPLDNLIWDRKLISKIFNFNYKWEVYTPVKERKYGYYVLPVVFNDRFIGRFEPIIDRKNNELTIQNWWWEKNVKVNPDMNDALIRCFSDFSKFLNVKRISFSNIVDKGKLNWIKKCVYIA